MSKFCQKVVQCCKEILSFLDSFQVFANVSGVTSDPAIEIIPLAEDGTTELTSKAPSAVNLANGDNVIEYTNEGHQLVKIEVTCDSGDAVTIDKINVVGRRTGAA